MLFDRFDIVDVDTHITEPPDTWTARMPSKWGEAIPHIERIDGFDIWVVNGTPYAKPGNTAMAGFDGTLPDGPATYDDMHPAAWDPVARVAFMDEQGIDAQVLYPEPGRVRGRGVARSRRRGLRHRRGAGLQRLPDRLRVGGPRSAAPHRVGAVLGRRARPSPRSSGRSATATAASTSATRRRSTTSRRCGTRTGTRSGTSPATPGCRSTSTSAAGASASSSQPAGEMGFRANFSRISSMLFVDNLAASTISSTAGSATASRTSECVSVESGVGAIPAALEAFDWQWRNGGVAKEHPECDLLPSEYFRRQIYGCFWFEREHVVPALLAYPDNMLFETDFPHPTCQHPGPQTPAVDPRSYAEDALGHAARRRAREGPGWDRVPCSTVCHEGRACRRGSPTRSTRRSRSAGCAGRQPGSRGRTGCSTPAWGGRSHALIARRDPVGSVLETDREVETAVVRALEGAEVPVARLCGGPTSTAPGPGVPA